MNEVGDDDLVELLHREAVERHLQEQAQARQLVERTHREMLEQQRRQEQQETALIEKLHRDAAERHAGQTPSAAEPPLVHYTQLPEATPEDRLSREWNTYRREAGHLLAQGNQGRHVLIQGEHIVGIWDTPAEALAAGYQRFPGLPFLVHQLQEWERVLRCVTIRQCPRLPFRSRPTS